MDYIKKNIYNIMMNFYIIYRMKYLKKKKKKFNEEEFYKNIISLLKLN